MDLSHCTLMYQNTAVVKLNFDNICMPHVAGRVIHPELLPLGVSEGANIDQQLFIWMRNRIIPDRRINIQAALETMGMESPMELSIHSLALSYHDPYWLKPRGCDIQWENINLHDNGFCEDVGDILFDPASMRTAINFISPDVTTGGNDLKRWIKGKDNRAYLMKGNPKYPQVAYNEQIAAILAHAMDIDAVPYYIRQGDFIEFEQGHIEKKSCTFAVCPNFCIKGYTFLTLKAFSQQYNNNTDIALGALLDNPDIAAKLEKIFLLDFLVNNEDRNVGNITVVLDKNNNIIDLAPIYDTGNSLSYGTMEMDTESTAENRLLHTSNKDVAAIVLNGQGHSPIDYDKLYKALEQIRTLLAKSTLSDLRKEEIVSFVTHNIEWMQSRDIQYQPPSISTDEVPDL